MNRIQLHIGVALCFAVLLIVIAVSHVDVPILVALAAATLLAVSFWHEAHPWLPPRGRQANPSARNHRRPNTLALGTTER